MRFIFNQNIHGIQKVTLSAYTEEQEHVVVPMEKSDDGTWFCKYAIRGRYFRYRYVLNDGIIILNDPHADYYAIDCFGQVWSIHDRFMTGKKKDIEINKSVISDRVLNDIHRSRSKKNLHLRENIKVSFGLELEGVGGIHQVTVIWHQPDGHIFRIENRTLDVPYEAGFVNASVWFWIDLKKLHPSYAAGIWTVESFIDGKHILYDNFMITEHIQEEYICFSAAV